MRRVLQPLWVFLALVFLAEAWLWEHLEPIVARLIAWIPLRALKRWLAARIERLSPPLTLVVFVVPFVLLLPLKFLEVELLTHREWLAAIGVLIFGKLLGVGVTAFIFDATRPKLMQMAWFRKMYDLVIRGRAWARSLITPIIARLRRIATALRTRPSPRYLRMIWRLRRRLQSVR